VKHYISFFLLAVITLAPLQGQCESWKDYFKDSDKIWQYDKDSIHYPKQKKILGVMVRDKNIVNVWIRKFDINKKYYEAVHIVKISCAERIMDDYPDKSDKRGHGIYEEQWGPLSIEPGTGDDNLLKKVCP
jgi:hypothetical protein